MNKKILSIILIMIFLTNSACFFNINIPITKAVTPEELRIQITILQTQIDQLKARLAALLKEIPVYEGIPVGFVFEKNLKFGDFSNEVLYLQIILKSEGVFCEKCRISGYFGYWTEKAVVLFQQKYASEILTPWKLNRGTGFVGKTTLAKLNALLGLQVQCVDSADCKEEEICKENQCEKIVCEYCQYIEEHQCKSYQCCANNDCDDSNPDTIGQCINPQTENSRCEYEAIQKCGDNTLYSQCSVNKPLYCDNGNLINNCSVCGCPSNKQCQEDENCIESPDFHCTSGPCCDTSTNTFRVSTYKCQLKTETEYGCAWGSEKSSDVGVRYRDRYCSGTSANCEGELKWSNWISAQDCTSNERCLNNSCSPLKCSDNTLYGQCSTTKPLYCDNGNLINNCSVCGCPSGKECQVNGDCFSDTIAPSVSFTSPASGFVVSETVSLNVTASDNVGVTKVEFYYNSALIGTDSATPYSVNWNTTQLANGNYILFAKAYDKAGNIGTSDSISIIVLNGLSANVIIGKPNFSEIIPNTTVSHKLYLPHGVIVDRTGPRDKFYVYDAGNNRILGLDLATCINTSSDPAQCQAEIVLGQPNMSTSACNGDSGFQNYPVRAPASASTLCGLPEMALSVSESGSGSSMAVDSQGNLYVTDFFNHRVLKYNHPFGSCSTCDTIADDFWGQNDFAGNMCNKGQSLPDATTLCFSWGRSNNWTAGVDIDSEGNLWVVDSGNNRVLRFPSGSKTANLVLGQTRFTSRSFGSGLDKFDDPSAIRINERGWVYVTDNKNQRVLVFKPPFSFGMSGNVFAWGLKPAGVDFDPTQPGKIWITNAGYNTIELWDENNPIGSEKTVGRTGNGNLLGDATGSVGIDSSGNILIAIGVGDYDNDVLFFSKQDILTGKATNQPSKRIFGWGGANGNLKTRIGLGSGNGVVVVDNQLIVADHERLMFWNNASTLTSGKPADGVAGKGVYTFTDRAPGCCMVIKADKNHHLWIAVNMHGDDPVHIEVYQLPLINGAQPIKTINFPFQTINGERILLSQADWSITGLAPADDGQFLWISQASANRVFRIHNPLSNPVVDVILGQMDSNGIQCNRGAPNVSGAADNTLCHPGALSLDRFGNLYVSDHWLEIYGNYRLLVFNKNLFPINNTKMIYAPSASKIFPGIATWEPAFDSQNRMVVGYNPYWVANPKGGWFPGIYIDPLGASTIPDAFLKDYHSMALSAAFDDYGNLYVGDHNRARVLIYKNLFSVF